jgi:hypothetical protein
MDFNDDLRKIQVKIVNCNEFVKKFEKIQFRGGEFSMCFLNLLLIFLFLGYEPYEGNIDEIVVRLLKTMRDRGYFADLKELDPKYDVELRKNNIFDVQHRLFLQVRSKGRPHYLSLAKRLASIHQVYSRIV